MRYQATMISGAAFVVLANAAASQPTAQTAPITIADLEGMTVEMTVLRTQIILREGRKVSTEHKSDVKFAIRPGNRLEGTLDTTVKPPKGTRQGETKTLSTTLEKAKNTKNFGPMPQSDRAFMDAVIPGHNRILMGALGHGAADEYLAPGGEPRTIISTSSRPISSVALGAVGFVAGSPGLRDAPTLAD